MRAVSPSKAPPFQAKRCPRDTSAAVSGPVGTVATEDREPVFGASDPIIRSRNRRG